MNTPNFFGEGSPFLNHPLLTPERTGSEVDFLIEQLELPAAAQILDVGCGFGRHSLELARRGYCVIGIDPAAAMVAAAQAQAAAQVQAAASDFQVDFQQADGQEFVTTSPIDVVLCLFTTLGQISASGENSKLIVQAYRNLKPGGYLVVEVPQRSVAVQALKSEDVFGEGERYTAVTRQFNSDTQVVTETFKMVSPEATRHFLLCYRLYNLPELTGLLTEAGFAVVGRYSGYTPQALTDDSATMLLICRK